MNATIFEDTSISGEEMFTQGQNNFLERSPNERFPILFDVTHASPFEFCIGA
jgi:hypothetical protein